MARVPLRARARSTAPPHAGAAGPAPRTLSLTLAVAAAIAAALSAAGGAESGLAGMDLFTASVAAWLLVELAFAVAVYFLLLPQLRPRTQPAPRVIPSSELFRRTLHMIESVPGLTFHDWIHSWFPGAAPDAKPRRGNVVEFFAWGFFAKEPAALTPAEAAQLEWAMEEVQERFGYVFEPGHDPALRPVRFTLETGLGVMHRPLAFYGLCAVVRLACDRWLARLGFVRHVTSCGVTYWHYSHATAQQQPPVIFFHGLGVGILPYIPLLRTLLLRRSVIAVEQPWISMTLHFRVPSQTAFVDAVREMVWRHSTSGKACIAGHSYGSVPAAWLCHEAPEVVANLMLLDPVSMCLADSTVVRRVLYNDCSTASGLASWLFVGSELGTAWTLRRHFHWYNQALFAQDLSRVGRSLVVVSDGDTIVPSDLIAKHLDVAGTNSDVVRLPNFVHGQMLVTEWARARIEGWLAEQEDASGHDACVPCPAPFAKEPTGPLPAKRRAQPVQARGRTQVLHRGGMQPLLLGRRRTDPVCKKSAAGWAAGEDLTEAKCRQ